MNDTEKEAQFKKTTQSNTLFAMNFVSSKNEVNDENDSKMEELNDNKNNNNNMDEMENNNNENDTDPILCLVDKFKKHTDLRYDCIENDMYVFDCVTCGKHLNGGGFYDLSDKSEYWNAYRVIYNHFVDSSLSQDHKRKCQDRRWMNPKDRDIKCLYLHFSMLQEGIEQNLGDCDWSERMLTRYREGAVVGNKGHSHRTLPEKTEFLHKLVTFTSCLCISYAFLMLSDALLLVLLLVYIDS